MDIEAHPFDLRECVESALDLIGARAAEKRLDIAYLFEGDVPAAIEGDVTRLRQILLNLLANAVKFTEARRGGADASRARAASMLHFAVRDTGIGLIEQRQEPAVPEVQPGRQRRTTRKYGGTGLGLAISKRLAELMGGTMWVESAGPGAGSHASTSRSRAVPAELPQGHAARLHRPAAAARRQAHPGGRRQRHQPPHPGAADGQVGHGGARHRVARAGVADARAGEAFDLAILDMHMPDMDGADAGRAHPRCRAHAAAGAVQLARPREAGAATACSRPRSPSRCARASCSTRWSACWREAMPRRAAPPRPRPSRAWTPAWRRATRCASCWPKTTW